MKHRTRPRCGTSALASSARPAGIRRRRWRIASSMAEASTPRRCASNAAVLADLKSLIPLAPLHQPFALQAIEILLAEVPQLPQIACFDTAFHRTLPAGRADVAASLRAVGTRHAALWLSRLCRTSTWPSHCPSGTAMRRADARSSRTSGSGASLCAMQELKSVATTMGFSALDGLMMGTRCGSLDAGVILHLLEHDKLSVRRSHAAALQEIRPARRLRRSPRAPRRCSKPKRPTRAHAPRWSFTCAASCARSAL